jgi:hypothetical protein
MKFVYQFVNAGYFEDGANVVQISVAQFDQLLQQVMMSRKVIGVNESDERLILQTDDQGSGVAFTFEFGQPTITIYKAKPKK